MTELIAWAITLLLITLAVALRQKVEHQCGGARRRIHHHRRPTRTYHGH